VWCQNVLHCAIGQTRWIFIMHYSCHCYVCNWYCCSLGKAQGLLHSSIQGLCIAQTQKQVASLLDKTKCLFFNAKIFETAENWRKLQENEDTQNSRHRLEACAVFLTFKCRAWSQWFTVHFFNSKKNVATILARAETFATCVRVGLAELVKHGRKGWMDSRTDDELKLDRLVQN
jgi:hypothetical protein